MDETAKPDLPWSWIWGGLATGLVATFVLSVALHEAVVERFFIEAGSSNSTDTWLALAFLALYGVAAAVLWRRVAWRAFFLAAAAAALVWTAVTMA